MTIEQLLEEAKRSNCFQITCTTLEGGVFRSYLITQNFPRNDMLAMHHGPCEDLIIDDLRQPSVQLPGTTEVDKQ